MCGLLAFFSKDDPIREGQFNSARDLLKSRGPDHAESLFEQQGRIALGHRRLSINDLSQDGHQPLTNENNSVWTVYNGEIYNYQSLKNELIQLGHTFKSTCDTEVLVHGWEQWKEGLVNRLRGIFAFVIWDSSTQTVFAARDHLGVKPLFYFYLRGELGLASQPKALVGLRRFPASVNESSFIDYVAYGVVPDSKSIFEHVKKVRPGQYLKFTNNTLEINQYWTPSYRPEIFEYKVAEQALADCLADSVKAQLLSDVPIGTFLSGGIDSSLICSIAQKNLSNQIQSLNIGFSEKSHDESSYAQLAANFIGTDHHSRTLKKSDFLSLIHELELAYDEPYALGASIPMLMISKFAQEQGLKVMLAGDGADELFAGYTHYDQARLDGLCFDKYRPHESLILKSDVLRVLSQNIGNKTARSLSWRFDAFNSDYADSNPVLAAQLLDMQTYLPDEILTKVDRASMAYGVEVRVPFLDQRLVELVMKIDHRLIYHNAIRKSLLKDVARAWLSPEILTQRKKGFSIPLKRWCSDPRTRLNMFKTVMSGYLRENNMLSDSFVNKSSVMLDTPMLWKLYVFERWAQRWITP